MIQVAEYEIPLALNAGPVKLPEFADVVESRLLRFDEFVARSALPRLHNNIVFPSDVAEGGTGISAFTDTDAATWLFVGIDAVLVLGGIS